MQQRFLSIDQIRRIEADAINLHHLNLMDMAGESIANWVGSHFTQDKKILVLVGRGNNGGDGVVAAIRLRKLGYNVAIYTAASQLNPTTEHLIQDFKISHGRQISRLPSSFNSYALIIDAILGIGIAGNVDQKLSSLIDSVNQSGKFILAVDTPTGLDPFNAQVYGNAIRASHTITFISDKPGFYTGSGVDLVGEVTLKELVDFKDYTLVPSQTIRVMPNALSNTNYSILARRLRNTNKGSFGTIAVVGGNCGMHGALYLAGRAAMLLGSGKVILASLDKSFATDLHMPELMLARPQQILKTLGNYSAVVVGPGFGNDLKAMKFLKHLFNLKTQVKFIFDADALNLIAKDNELSDKFKLIPNKIITPHPGEASRLLGISIAEVNQNRFAAIEQLRLQFNAITLLKGAGSLIRDVDHVYLNETGNSALSSGGQGDILCGITAAFIAQGMDLSSALRFAVFLHGKSAESLAEVVGYNGVLASEITYNARRLLNEMLYNEKGVESSV